jgi:hypothetical protein
MVDPNDLKARSFIQYALRDYHVQFVAISDDDFEKHGRKLLGERIELHSNVTPFEKMSYQDAEGEVRSVGDTSEEDLLSHLLTLAIRRGASDVHFEPYQGKARVRLRVDGRMVAIDEPIAPTTYRHLAARVKILAGLNTTRIRRPQFGRFLVEVDERQIEFRVAISPCHGGEKIVLRIVAPSHQLGKLSQLIVPPALRTLSRDLFQNPSGLILVTGPSGAGKTTTLYAALESVLAQDSSKNVVTIEDPVEYDLPFATQIQVNREGGNGRGDDSPVGAAAGSGYYSGWRDPRPRVRRDGCRSRHYRTSRALIVAHLYRSRGDRAASRPGGSALFDQRRATRNHHSTVGASFGTRLYRRSATDRPGRPATD